MKKLSPNQLEIVQLLRGQPGHTATLQWLFDNISWRHYYYKKMHLGVILKAMVKQKVIARTSKGVYTLCAGMANSGEQIGLFAPTTETP